MTLIQRILTGLLLLSSTQAVDRNNFKTCAESGFCKRQRAYNPESTPYQYVSNSLTVTSSHAEFFIKNTQNDVLFVIRLTGYTNGIVRVYMNEKEPLRPRYEVPPGDVVLENTLHTKKFDTLSKDSSGFTLGLPGTATRARLTKPFLLEVLSAETPLLQINSRGLLKFEHIRIKPAEPEPKAEDQEDNEDTDAGAEEGSEEPPAPEDAEESKPEEAKPEAEEEEHAQWEEKYKSHHDAKPNGATSIGVDMTFVGVEHIYGIPEHADSLALKSTVGKDPYRLYNLDVFEYEIENGMALYGSVPVMLAHSTARTIGVFWNNPSEMWIDITSSKADRSTLGKIVDFVTQDDKVPQMDTRWVAESGVFDMYVMMGPTPYEIFKQYASLTGTTSLPPIFSIAYHQSRWNYNDEADVKQIHDNFDKHDIPIDVVWLDIEHTDGKRYFTWDGGKFPSSLDMVANLTAKGRKLVTIVDPHIKRDDNYHIYKEIRDKDLFVKRSGSEFDGWCWPGSSSYPDFTRKEMREWWASKFSYDQYKGTDENVFTWNDMNEPSVFNGPEITMHKDVVHHGGWEHRDVHNLYGFYVHQATAEGQIHRSGGTQRPFVLSRAFYAGSQRHGAVWTGDNMGEWSHLKYSIPMILSQSITGITFTGADIGGFFRNPSAELVTRWYQTAAFTPFFRAHSHLDTRRREPWLLAEENMKIIRDAIITRYQLLPYWYTLFYTNEKEGIPPTRPMWVEFPKDINCFSEEQQFMLGQGMLVRTVLEESATGVDMYFPGNASALWYDAADYKQFIGGSKTHYPVTMESQPYFYRGGYIIPRKNRVRRSSTQMTNDPYTLVVALDSQGEANGELYVDDYKSFQYRQGQYMYRKFSFSGSKMTSSQIDVSNFKTGSWLEAVRILGYKSAPSKVTLSVSGESDVDLGFTYDPERSVLLIRRPFVNMSLDWSISLL